MKFSITPFALAAAVSILISCNQSNNENQNHDGTHTPGQISATYIANLEPLNSNITGMSTTAQAKIVVTSDSVFVNISATDVPPNMQHWQHFHGFKDNSNANCTSASSDKNNDGIVDVVETEEASGTTMVPFNSNPAEMNIGSDSYPNAGKDSSYHYEARISLAQLKAAFASTFGDSSLDLDKRVIYIHGVPSGTSLPNSVASVGNFPAQTTLPIACGKIEKISENN